MSHALRYSCETTSVQQWWCIAMRYPLLVLFRGGISPNASTSRSFVLLKLSIASAPSSARVPAIKYQIKFAARGVRSIQATYDARYIKDLNAWEDWRKGHTGHQQLLTGTDQPWQVLQ